MVVSPDISLSAFPSLARATTPAYVDSASAHGLGPLRLDVSCGPSWTSWHPALLLSLIRFVFAPQIGRLPASLLAFHPPPRISATSRQQVFGSGFWPFQLQISHLVPFYNFCLFDGVAFSPAFLELAAHIQDASLSISVYSSQCLDFFGDGVYKSPLP